MKGQTIKYKPVGNYKQREAEILDISLSKIKIKIKEPIKAGAILEINHPLLPQYGETFNPTDYSIEIFIPGNIGGIE